MTKIIRCCDGYVTIIKDIGPLIESIRNALSSVNFPTEMTQSFIELIEQGSNCMIGDKIEYTLER